jgi:hypothetical protein
MKNILLILLIFSSSLIYSQVTVYATYEDFKNQKGIEYDDFKNYLASIGGTSIYLIKNGKTHKIKCNKNIWGFVYKDALFKVFQKYRQPVRLISQGKICYYENGFAHLTILKTGRSSGQAQGSNSVLSFFSASLNSPIVPFKGTDERSESGQLFNSDSKYKQLSGCLKKYMDIDFVRGCVSNFEKSNNE